VIVAKDRLPVVSAMNHVEAETFSELPKLSSHGGDPQQDSISDLNPRITREFVMRDAESAT
jgi:hypothetical protein